MDLLDSIMVGDNRTIRILGVALTANYWTCRSRTSESPSGPRLRTCLGTVFRWWESLRGAVAFADRWAGRCSWRPVSDRPGELGERRGDSKLTRGFGGEFVVAAAEVLDEGESGDDDLSGLCCA
jgi:hypothetical protein